MLFYFTGGENFRLLILLYMALFAAVFTETFEEMDLSEEDVEISRRYLFFMLRLFFWLSMFYVFYNIYYECLEIRMIRYFCFFYIIQIKTDCLDRDDFRIIMVLLLDLYLILKFCGG